MATNTGNQDIIKRYNTEVANLPAIHQKGGGKARSASGKLFEDLIQRICVQNGLTAKKNDYKRTAEVNGACLTNLQVDKHIYRNGKMVRAVESKCYLDACYLKRAVSDFVDLNASPDVPDAVEYAITAGQECVSRQALNYYRAYFERATNKKLGIFIINQHKKRNGSRAIYMEHYNVDFQLDVRELQNFINWLTYDNNTA